MAFMSKSKRQHNKSLNAASLLAALGCLPLAGASVASTSVQALAPGDRILNTATVSYGLSADALPASPRTLLSQKPSAELITFAPNPVAIAIGNINASLSGGSGFILSASAGCVRSGELVSKPPVFVSRNLSDFGSALSFEKSSLAKSGDAVFVEVRDDRANVNGSVIETIDVTLETPSGDKEVIRLAETEPDSGRFIGYVQTARAAITQNDCELAVGSNERITANYQTPQTTASRVEADILIDPLGVVFDSVTGEIVDGVSVTLIDVATGNPAQVFGDDGKTPYPSTVKSGASVTDAGGNFYPGVPGQFRFPLVKPGSYRLVVDGGRERAFPSQFGLADLQDKFAGSHYVTAASLGASFLVSMGVVQVDVPVDATSGKLLVNKSASVSSVGIGDFVQYTVNITNRDAMTVQDVVFHDRLPPGLRVRPDSFSVNGVKTKATHHSPSDFSYAIGNMAPGASATIRYVTEVTPQTPLGEVSNLAHASGRSAVSNDAFARIQVRDELLSDRMFLIGNVTEVQACGKPGKPVPSAKILFETGNYVVTDANGAWHMDKLQVGGHVARLDPLSLPDGYEPILCEDDTQAAGSASSRFVQGSSASLKRVDFYVKKSDAKAQADAQSLAQMLQDSLMPAASVPSQGEPVTLADGRAGTQVTDLHDRFAQLVKAERAFVFPGSNFSPTTTAVGVAISAPQGETVALFVNDREVAGANYEGSKEVPAAGASLHYWSSVPLRDGMNDLQARFFKDGQQVGSVDHHISFSSNIVSAKIDANNSRLIADGRTPIEVTVALLDEYGRPAYKGLTGSFNVEGGFTPYLDRADGAPAAMLARLKENQNIFKVGEGGLAKIRLEPSSNGGQALITLGLKDKRIVLRPWIKAKDQPWVVVGFAEGTLAHRRISESIKRTPGGQDLVDDGGRVAFYAKGTIAADTLATIAYDTRPQPRNGGSALSGRSSLGQGVGGDAFEVYGDESISQRDGERSGKLYVRIERDRFYAMFGRMQAGLSVTELTHYARVIDGLKSAYQGDRYEAVGFVSEVTGVHQVTESPVEIISGSYIAPKSIKPSSETVTIITRSSSQRDVVLERKTLERYVDYEVDYGLGIVRLNQSVSAYDLGFNPRFVRIEYDTDEADKTGMTAGGRIAIKELAGVKGLEIGVSAIAEDDSSGSVGKSAMAGVDVRYTSDNGKISGSVEFAGSARSVNGASRDAQGVSAQAQYSGDKGTAKVYYKRVEPDFGLSTAVAAESAIEKFGLDGTHQVSEDVSLNGSVVSRRDMLTSASNVIVESRLQANMGERTQGYAGVKHQINEARSDQDDKMAQTTAATFGLQHKVQDLPARLSGQAELPTAESNTVPRRLRMGVEYDLLSSVTLSAEREDSQYKSTRFSINRVGVRAQPWSGGQVNAAGGSLEGNQPNEFYRVGVDQSVEISPGLSVNAGYSKQQWAGDLPKLAVPAGSIVSLDSYQSYRAGVVYRNDTIVAQLSAEHLEGKSANRDYLQGDVYRKLEDGYAIGAGFGSERLIQGLRVSLSDTFKIMGSYRNPSSPYSGLVSLRFNELDQAEGKASNMVFNALENYKLAQKWQLFAHQGIKHASVTFNGEGYEGWTYLINGGLTYKLTHDWDVSASLLRAYALKSGAGSEGAAISVAHAFQKNARLELGYQYLDRLDRNFAFSSAYVKGLFMRMALKFDENSLGLNEKAAQSAAIRLD